MTRRRLIVGLLFLALGIAAFRDLARIGKDLPWRVMYDFQDFYCAGAAADAGADPYMYEPLRTCEHAVNPALFRQNASLAIPAPQPPYDLPPFMMLARLEFMQARAFYAIAIVVVLVLTVLVLWRLGMPLDVAALALLLAPGYQELAAGQIVPFVLLFLVLAGWMLQQRRDALAGLFAGLTAIEPHLGAGIGLALLLFVAGARWSLLLTYAGMALIGLVSSGIGGTIAYVTRVLPAQAAAEIGFPPQYSLTYALHEAGTPDRLALQIGALSFCIFLIAGCVIAPGLSRRLNRREMLVFFPAATVIMAGAYVHVVELCVAIPAALVLARYSGGSRRNVAAASLCLLAIPWIAAWSVKKLFLTCIFVTAALLYRLRAAPSIAVPAAIGVAAALYAFELHPPRLPSQVPMPATAFAAGSLVQVEWATVVRELDARDPMWLAIKLPTWIGLAGIFLSGLSEYGAGERRAGVTA